MLRRLVAQHHHQRRCLSAVPATAASSPPPQYTLATPLVKKNKLDAAFAECDSKEELEQLVLGSSKYDFNSWNVMTAFSRLGRLGKGVDANVYKRLLEIERDMRRPEAGERKFTPQEIEVIATGVALGPLAPKLPDFVLREMKSLASFAGFMPNSLTNLSYAFANLEHLDYEIVGRLVQEIADGRRAEDFNTNQASVLLQTLGWWFAQAAKQQQQAQPQPLHLVKRDAAFAKLSQAVIGNGQHAATANQLANALNGSVRAGYKGDELFDYLYKSFPLEAKVDKPAELVNIVHSVSMKNPTWALQFFEQRAAPLLVAMHAKLTPQQITLLLGSFAQLKWKSQASKELVDLLLSEITRRKLGEFINPEVLGKALAELDYKA